MSCEHRVKPTIAMGAPGRFTGLEKNGKVNGGPALLSRALFLKNTKSNRGEVLLLSIDTNPKLAILHLRPPERQSLG